MVVSASDVKERTSNLLEILNKIAIERKAILLPITEKIGKKIFEDYEIRKTGFLRKIPILRARFLYSSGNVEGGPYTELLIAHKEEELPRKTLASMFEEKFSAIGTKPVYVKFVEYREAKKRNFTD